jgi:serine/threonine-protein kinase RsbT
MSLREKLNHLPLDVSIKVERSLDIVVARNRAREVAQQVGFAGAELTLIASAASELARNIVHHAGSGEMTIRRIQRGSAGIFLAASDRGPGIADLARVLASRYSGSGGLGLDMVRRIMDEFEITSEAGRGTVVAARKWLRG